MNVIIGERCARARVSPRLLASAVLVALFALDTTGGAYAAAKPTGELCLAPFHAKPSPVAPPGMPPPPPPPSEPSLSETTWEPRQDSHFTFFIDGRKRATLGNGESVHLTGLRADKPLRVRVQLDGRPFETFSLDFSKYDHRICLWLYPGYWHWIDNGWDAKLGCRCGEKLTITDGSPAGSCRPVPANWQPSGPVREARAADVADDLKRYFGGLSVQVTPFVDAVFGGRVHFCTEGAEAAVLHALAELVVRPPKATDREGQLPLGAEDFLRVLASSELVRQLESIAVGDGPEAQRRAAALEQVRLALQPAARECDVVAALDGASPERIDVHFLRHAAVYVLPRRGEHFDDGFALLKTSLEKGTTVCFTHGAGEQQITAVELQR